MPKELDLNIQSTNNSNNQLPITKESTDVNLSGNEQVVEINIEDIPEDSKILIVCPQCSNDRFIYTERVYKINQKNLKINGKPIKFESSNKGNNIYIVDGVKICNKCGYELPERP